MEKPNLTKHPAGLCETCRHVRVMQTKTSRFYLCKLSATSDSFPKYPKLPVLRCTGHEPVAHDA